LPDDPDGVLAALPEQYKKQYAGYRPPVHKSPWENFKAKGGPPYDVTLSFAQVTGPTQLGMYEGMKKAFAKNKDINFEAVTTGSQLNVPQQLQQFSSQLDKRPDLMIVEPLTDAFGQLTDKAAKLGIPVISIQGTTTSKNAINVQSNSYGIGAVASSVSFRQMGGKGNVLYVHGIASSPVDVDAYAAFKAALKNCPNIKNAGEIAGAFVSATNKSETLKFLATHPEPIDAVIQLGGTPGVIDAFKQAGRPIPLVVDRGGFKGSLGYWINNRDKYHNTGLGWPPYQYGATIADFTAKVLNGDGIKISDTTAYYANITDKNLDQWAKPEWDLQTPGVSEGTPGAFMSNDYINGLFNNPSN
jgi:ribose transport system substrate-binding protein